MFTKPIRLDKAFTQGIIYDIKLEHNGRRSPFKGYLWLILSGHIHFEDTGTMARLEHQTETKGYPPYARLWATSIPAAQATGEYSLFNNEPDADASQWSPIIVAGEDESLAFFCMGTANYVQIRVLEWKP